MIKNMRTEPLKEARFVEPLCLFYEEDGKQKRWELIKAHDSVAVLIYNEDDDAFVLVKQFRPPVYLKNQDGYTYELCAGILDKNKSEQDTAIEEIEEETGYKISAERIERITEFYTAVGFAGSRQTLFLARVNERDRVGEGGGVDTEKIEVVKVPRKEALRLVFDESKVKTPGLAFAISWFLLERS
ncbi:MAG: NUDIX domain-containing protein [Helicobacteraceae bacterium]|jgi:UDP-sugar diphosphatase|nr:NUDIX domain-containing protein [Helicobacteraceae bacterium]